MLKRIKQEKAITLIALVITIIVILILAGISIVTLTGENGIINKANVAKEESKKAEYKEELELIGLGLQVEDGINNLSTKDFMDKYQDEIRRNKKFKEAKVSNQTTENDTIVIIVITKEGYVYKITKTKVDFIGKQGETAPPDLEESDIEGICNPSDWTNGEVKVTVKVNNKELSKYTIKYSLDGKTNWRTYTGQIAFKDNGSLFVRVENELLEFGGVTVVNVANIDRLAPKQFVPTATSTTNSITLTGSTTDTPKTEKDGCSGIKEYYFSNDNGATWKQNSNKLATSYTFNKLTQGKEYTLKMKAVDKAGNEVVTNAITKTTGKVEGLTESNVKFQYTPSTPTKGSVKVKITTDITGYTLRYSKDGKQWTNYTQEVTMTDNGDIYAQLWDGTNAGGYATGNVANIDRLAPKQFVPTATSTTNSITLTGSTTDTPKTEKDGCSGIKEYYFSNDNGATWKQNSNKLATSYTFNKLTQGKEYTLKMKAVDKAGNEVVTSAITKTTGKVEGAKGATYSPTTWTNKDVEVTLPTKAGYTTRYVTNGGIPTKDSTEYKGPFKVSKNCVINYCYSDGTNIGGNGTANITIIDKIAPQEFTPTVTSTIGKGLEDGTGAITITGYAKDKNDENNQNKCSGVKYYYFKINNSDWIKYDENSNVTTSSPATYTVTGLNSGDKCTIQMKAIDKAGNETITKPIDKYIGYSKNGLIMQYDGINNTKNGHDTNAKIWEDISGNNNDLMPAEGKFSWNQGSGWTDNGLELDGIDDYLYLDSNPLYDENNKAPDMTVEVISEKLQKTDGGPHSGYGMLISFGGIVNVTHFMDLWCVYCDDGTNRAYSIYENSLISDINASEPNVGYGQTNAITYGKTGNKMFAYLNNVTREGKIVSGQTGKYTNICDKFDGWVIDDTKPNGVFYLGREHKSVPDTSKPTEINTEPIYFFKGIIKSVRVYNRALEDWERNDNYDTDCQRYNIK